MNIVPKKSLGQNFLLNKEIINKIIDLGKITNESVVLEIGPGTGNLTKQILERKPKIFFAIEKPIPSAAAEIINFLFLKLIFI